ncbi:hypothetical protein Goari_011734 [Gossypium aridum]|uniref:Uncharacterized protein n=1 Tax=Gossypium aridum TaxID=34290 RepID=A0A7J8WYA8_GOSAI|nr:hypothetical protein [Gossypium aridum]
MLLWFPVWSTCTMLEPLTQIQDLRQSFMTCSVENTIMTLVKTSIDSLLSNMLVIRKPNNLDIEVSLIMINLLSSTQKIKSLGKMLKQLLILLKK